VRLEDSHLPLHEGEQRGGRHLTPLPRVASGNEEEVLEGPFVHLAVLAKQRRQSVPAHENVTLELESIDLMYLNVYVPELQCDKGVW
jgi:hypothetical protein